ncbi:hypothetical protein QA641_37710 [Bradyrhizobium sp. CB1650]|uniref:hypothetical protein n=1 Tax=Bradyrhizobium sp. CB1650 TaxID=3039153 RepID=UPI0024351267|nr:hypothetical protein [Bradyrhizobium sp. CB1650]WGD51174.1 hypothetical protein QA641_37710 [Bradyrhizobium sp. CB1650]
MRESSHFDGHQTTGYNLPKNITRYASHRIAPDATGATRTSPNMLTVFPFAAAQVFWALAEAHPNCCLGSGSIPLPNSHERPRSKERC